MRLINAQELYKKLEEERDKYKNSTNNIDQAVAAGLEIALCDVLLAEEVKQ